MSIVTHAHEDSTQPPPTHTHPSLGSTLNSEHNWEGPMLSFKESTNMHIQWSLLNEGTSIDLNLVPNVVSS